MGQITTTQNLVAIKEVRHAGQQHHDNHLGSGAAGWIKGWQSVRHKLQKKVGMGKGTDVSHVMLNIHHYLFHMFCFLFDKQRNVMEKHNGKL